MAIVTEDSTTHTEWTIDGSNTDFGVTAVPNGYYYMCHVNGLFQKCSLASQTFTLTAAPEDGDEVSFTFTTASTSGSYQTVLGIVNMALQRIGADQISDINSSEPNAIRAMLVWDYILTEVLEAFDWRFAKTRAELTKNATAPLYSYDYAYDLPTDFLRLVKATGRQKSWANPAAITDCYWAKVVSPGSYNYSLDYDPRVYPGGMDFIIESLPDGGKALLSNYDSDSGDIYINYIRREIDPTAYEGMFTSALAYRLAAELAPSVTESAQKQGAMLQLYEAQIRKAQALTSSFDNISDETGSNTWANAGR